MSNWKKFFIGLFLFLLTILAGSAYWFVGRSPIPHGAWQGTLDSGMTTFRVVLELPMGPDGGSPLFTNIDDGIYGQSFQRSALGRKRFRGELPTGEVLKLEFDRSDGSFHGSYTQSHGSFQKPGKVSSLVLRPGNDFLHARRVSPSVVQRVYSYQPPQKLTDGWETGDVTRAGMDVPRLAEGMGKILDGTYPHIHSVLVVKKGKLVLDEYFYGYGPQDLHPVHSITKSVFSILFGIARDKGLLEPRQKLYFFFPEYRAKTGWDPRKDRVTLESLLTMKGGFACNDWENSKACSWDMVDSSDWLHFALSRPLDQAPGRQFAYCGACLTPLSSLVARKSGVGVMDFANANLFEPLGIQEAAWMAGPGGVTPVSFGLSLRPRDLAKLGWLVLKEGKWEGKRVVSQDWIRRSTAVHVPRKQTGKEADYGYLWWERDEAWKGKKIRVIEGWGVGGQHLFIAPRLQMVCVITGGNYKDSKLSANARKLFRENILAGAR